MTAFGLSPRVLTKKLSFNIDPGAYQNGHLCHFRKNKVSFNSSSKRETGPANKLNVDVLYNADNPPRIQTPTVFKSKVPRFPYEAFSKEDLEQLLCYCGLELPCDCDDKDPAAEQDEAPEEICQAKQKKKLIIGSPFARPSKTTITSSKPNPPFYDATVNEFTKFYHGCKWSRWTSQRTPKTSEVRPGPADYDVVSKPTQDEICLELTRHHHRKHSKQPRFIEIIQNKTIRDDQPSPATYEVKEPKCSEPGFRFLKADRFPKEKVVDCPGPAAHWIKRFADLPPPLERLSIAKLPERACFGTKAGRFKNRQQDGPSPASYDVKLAACNMLHCPNTPFGSSAKRFPDPPIEEFDEEESEPEIEAETKPRCPEWSWTWSYRSRTQRFKPIVKKLNEPSPADFLQPLIVSKRSRKLQYLAPFSSSEGRFVPWYDWMSIIGSSKTPGPAYYCLEKKGCPTAVPHGPQCRARRFKPVKKSTTPAPNSYDIEKKSDVLMTFNSRLKENINRRPQYTWDPPVPKRKYTLLELEANLLDRTIALLDDVGDSRPADVTAGLGVKKSKLLKCFV